MTDIDAVDVFPAFAWTVVEEFADNLIDAGPEEQAQRAIAALKRFHGFKPLRLLSTTVNLFGFAEATSIFASGNDVYFRLLPVARQLGMTERDADEWARKEWLLALEEQRRDDEERGQLGYEHLDAWLNLDLWLIFDDETAKPDAGGRRWNDAQEWLISTDRIMSLLLASPWSKEFMANTKPLMSFAMKHSGLEERFTGDSPAGGMFAKDREAISENEARDRAFRGPHLPTDTDDTD